MNPLAFYRGEGADHAGRTLAEILSWDHGRLERVHDYIQWLFPLAEPSGVNPQAPLVDADTERAFQSDPRLRQALEASLRAMLDFYGLTLRRSDGDIVIDRSAAFTSRAAVWLTPHNHNFLRLTRILKSLTLLGRSDCTRALFQALDGIYQDKRHVIGPTSYAYWKDAVRS